jgi:hypothetical protein
MFCVSRHNNDAAISPEERDARRQVHCLRGFYHHAAVFVLVNSLLVAIDLLGSPDRLWFHWPLMGWGVWLALHAWGTFGRQRWLGRDWEERKVRELMAGKG